MGQKSSDSTISRVITAALGAMRRSRDNSGPPRSVRARVRSPSASRPRPAQWSVALLQRLDWQRFDELCAAYFEEIGYRTEGARAASGEALELALFSQARGKPVLLVHCASHSTHESGVMPVRELLAAMAARAVSEGFFITRGGFSEQAQDFAAVQRIRLIDGEGFIRYLNALLPEQSAGLHAFATEGDYTTPTCPACGIKMTPRASRAGDAPLWGCVNFPVCDRTLSVPAPRP